MEENNNSNKKEVDPFTRFMFGPGRNEDVENTEDLRQHKGDTINFEELMTNFDALMDSAGKLKPLLQKVYPFVEQIWKKN
ncbi:MAG: hypothetical protein Q8906_16060 [Bacillota bacterium]|nr:hypothetical protein [Bacillota bacterium]